MYIHTMHCQLFESYHASANVKVVDLLQNYLSSLLTSGNHDDGVHLILPHHSPEPLH